jgi:hypothetical protein
MRQPAEETHDTTIALRMPAEQVAFLRAEAERNERTLSAEIRLLVRRAMETEQERRAA